MTASQKVRNDSPTRRFLLSALLVIISALLTLAAAEVLARYLYTGPWYEKLVAGSPDTSAQGQVVYRLRSRKFPFFTLRDQTYDFDAAKAPDERRILVLGDSFTYGAGVAADSAVFPSLLEKRLNADLRLPGVGHVNVLNGGLPGSLTRHWVSLWENLSKQYQPDVLLIVFFLRDGTLTSSIPDFFGKIRDEIVVRNSSSFLYQHSYLYRTIRDGLDRRSVGEKYTRVFVESYLGNEQQTTEWRRAQANLLRLQALAKEQSVTVGLVIFPVLFELNENYPFRQICDRLEAFAVEHGIPVHSLLPDFMGQDGPSLWVSALDQHPNEQGHRIAADGMLPFVRGLLEARETGRD